MGSENKRSFARLVPAWGKPALIWDEGRGVSWGQAGGHGCFAPSLRWWYVQGGIHSTLFLFRLFKSGSWVFWSLCILWVVPLFLMHTGILVPYSFFVLCCSMQHLSRCKHCRSRSQVPGLSHSLGSWLEQMVRLPLTEMEMKKMDRFEQSKSSPVNIV